MELICCEGIREYNVSPFSLTAGKIMSLGLPYGMDLRFCERNKNSLLRVNYKPYWVKFLIEKIDKESIDIINQNIEYLRPYFSSNFIPNQELTKGEILSLSGWDIRLINMFIMRKKGITFFEINTAGLSIQSIFLMFKFLLHEIVESNYICSYLAVNPCIKVKNTNPILITDNNLQNIFEVYENNN